VEQEYFVVTLYQMDIERVRYALARYYRTRLLKIEKDVVHIMSNIDLTDRLCASEKDFATKLNDINNKYFEDNVTNKLQLEESREMYDMAENRALHALPQDQVCVSFASFLFMSFSGWCSKFLFLITFLCTGYLFLTEICVWSHDCGHCRSSGVCGSDTYYAAG
jgi:hypothetical protein